jgi:dipeptidyl aminopeptidase/acylaminoacyl peptidase
MTPSPRTVLYFFLTLLLCSLSNAQEHSRAAAVYDSMPMGKKVDLAVISPDGTQVAYIVAGELTVASLQDRSSHSVAIGGGLRFRAVSWSTDSKQIVFLADLSGAAPSAQLWTAAADGTSPTKRADLKGYADAPSFSPDGTRLVLLFTEGMPRVAGPLEPMTPLAGVVGEKIYEQRLASIDLSTNAFEQLTPADMYVYEYDWTPDGQSLVAVAAHGSGDANWYVARLYRIESHTGDTHEIYAPKYQIAKPAVSPDGQNVAFIEGLMSDEGPTGGDIFIVPVAGGTARNLTPNIESSPSYLTWTSPKEITFAEIIDGKSGFGCVGIGGGARQLWSGEEFLGTNEMPSASFSRSGKITAVVRQSPNTPPEVWAGQIGRWKQVSSINPGLKPAWGETHNVHWMNGKDRVEGWLILPKDYDSTKSYPLVVNVHGGPSFACRPLWDGRLMGAESAMGYFVLCPNPHGSYGQGEAFTRANIRDFGGGDFRDIMAGIDALVKKYPIDVRRLGIRGHSYGGYMTMWAETQTPRFTAAVAGAGLSDWLSYYGVNEIDEWMMPFFGASIYDDPAVYAKSDPIHFVKNVKTPTLILVGDSDGEVPMEQSIEWWHALQSFKVPTQLVIYPNEGHIFVRSADDRDYAVRTLDWFEKWFTQADEKRSDSASSR